MTDFNQWLYANYIKPYLEQCPRTGYEMELDFTSDLCPSQIAVYERVLEFWASRAFLLGVKTGAGLRDALMNTQGR